MTGPATGPSTGPSAGPSDSPERTDGVPEGITLLGAEMLTWSDLDVEHGPGALRGSLPALLLERLDTAPRRRALVAGPHTAAVVLDVARAAEHTDVLVRSYPDAEALRAELPPSVQVHCGPLDRFAATASPYDVVVALDGLPRLHSGEQPRPEQAQVVDQLAGLLAPDGDLLLALHNEVGLDVLLALDPATRADDSQWPEGVVQPAPVLGMQAALDGLEEDLAGSARIAALWSCFGPRRHPLLAIPTGLLSSLRTDQRLLRLVARASAPPTDPDGPSVTDPGRAVTSVVGAGLGAELAPQWVAHLTARAHDPGTERSDPDDLDDLVLVAESPDDRPPVPHVVRLGESTSVREPIGDPAVQRWTDAVRCDPARLAGPVPSGPALDDLLAAACAAHDLVALGDLVRRYRRWLAADGESDPQVPDPQTPDPQVPGDRVPLTLADLVVGPDGVVEVVDGRLVADGPAPLDEVLLRTLLVAGQRLLESGAPHPWSAMATPATIARSLAAAAGIEVELPLMDRAVALDRRLRPESVDFLAVAPPAASYDDLVHQVAEYRLRLTEAEAQLEWLVSNIHVRQRALRASRGRASDLETSLEYRVGKRVVPFRTLVRKGRAWARDRREGPLHEWRAKPKQRDPIPVDPDLLPKGYRPKGDEV